MAEQSRRFEPEIRVFQPQANSRESHMGTVRIRFEDPDTGEARVVHVLAHRDGMYRFRLNLCPAAIVEAFLSGNRPDNHAIIGVSPRA